MSKYCEQILYAGTFWLVYIFLYFIKRQLRWSERQRSRRVNSQCQNEQSLRRPTLRRCTIQYMMAVLNWNISNEFSVNSNLRYQMSMIRDVLWLGVFPPSPPFFPWGALQWNAFFLLLVIRYILDFKLTKAILFFFFAVVTFSNANQASWKCYFYPGESCAMS